jgi:hypothetical protein
MNFRLIGGYATVNGPDNAGVASAPLLSPPSVQEFLVESQEGGAYFYPPVAPADATSADLCAFIAQYDVTAVVDVAAGAQGFAVRSYFSAALGQPQVTLGNIALYRPNGSCPLATS